MAAEGCKGPCAGQDSACAWRNRWAVRSRQFESAIAAFVEAAGVCLGELTAAGEEVPFEIVAQPSRSHRAPLYFYRPLTSEFIRQRGAALEALPNHPAALAAIEELDGVSRYLLLRGATHAPVDPREEARVALQMLLEEVFEGQSDFEVRPDMLETALNRLQETGGPDGDPVVVVGTLHGLTLSSPEVALARGLRLAAPDAVEGAPEAAVAVAGPCLLAVISTEGEDSPQAIADAAAALTDLVRALRLFGDGRITLGALAWSRVGAGPWRPLALGTGGRPRGMLVVTAEQEDELRAFCSLVARRTPQDGEVAWALERFHLGAERQSDHAALTDYLLALRALLEPEGPASGLLAGRLAAICAVPAERQMLVDRVLHAVALERAVVRGEAPLEAASDTLIQAIGGHLRALLRDVVCGHLDRDLVSIADELLLGPATTEHAVAAGPELDSDEELDDWWVDPAPVTAEPPFAGAAGWPRDVKTGAAPAGAPSRRFPARAARPEGDERALPF